MMIASTIRDSLPENAPFASFAGGCFWCIESEFRRLEGVLFTRSGYEGGHVENPKDKDIYGGQSGHAEVTEIYYDPDIISYPELLEHFLTLAHDPTDAGGQGVDRGAHYRSVIFYHDEAQKAAAERMIAALENQKYWKKPIVTTIEPHGKFWPAEPHHQQYYEKYEEKTGVPHIRALYKLRKWAKQG